MKCGPRATPLAVILIAATVALTFSCRRAAEQPLTCPPGATLMGAPPPKGEEVWCEKVVNGKPVKDGIFIVYGTGGGKMLEGYYRDGKQDGLWTMWYENGARAAVDHYQGGVRDGPHTSWYANGAKSIEGNYRNGKREGVWTRWDPSGLTSHQQNYRDDKIVR
jgi:antitoxin component YwqK of YwqJK toxin-antitoxin module